MKGHFCRIGDHQNRKNERRGFNKALVESKTRFQKRWERLLKNEAAENVVKSTRASMKCQTSKFVRNGWNGG